MPHIPLINRRCEPRPRRARYGIRYRTIRYWQDHAITLRNFHGIKPLGCFSTPQALDTVKSAAIGHDAISVAAVYSPHDTREILAGRLTALALLRISGIMAVRQSRAALRRTLTDNAAAL